MRNGLADFLIFLLLTNTRNRKCMIILFLFLSTHISLAMQQRILFQDHNALHKLSSSVDTHDALRYRVAELNWDLLQNADSNPSVRPGDLIIVNLFPNTADTIIVDRIFNFLSNTYTIRGRPVNKKYSLCLLTFTGKSMIGLHLVPEEQRQYHFIQDPGTGLCCIKEMNLNDLNVLNDEPCPIPPNAGAKPGDTKNLLATKERLSDQTVSPQSATSTLDVMIVYTPAAKKWAQSNDGGINNTISQAMSASQTALDNSGISISLNLVLAREVAYTESGDSNTDLNRLTFHSGYDPWNAEGNTQYMDEIHDWRNTYNADLTAILTECDDTGGLGWLLNTESGSPEFGFCLARVQQVSWAYTLIHEWGHNLGAHHRTDQKVQPGPGLYAYSAAWRWLGQNGYRYCSVMSYSDSWEGEAVHVVGYFSNPSIDYQGVATGKASAADNVRGINQIRAVVADYRKGTTTNNPSISGYVRNSSGAGMAGVSISFSPSAGVMQTNSSGFYSFVVSDNWSGMVTPSLSGYSFNPSYRSFTNVTSLQANKDFTAYPTNVSNQIKVLTPNGGESWREGDQRIITWLANTPDTRVNVDLYRNGQFFLRLKSNGTGNDGDFTWDLATDMPADDHYQIKISGIQTGTSDISDSYFTIRDKIIPPGPTLIYPKNGDSDVISTLRFEWSSLVNTIYLLQVSDNHDFSNCLVNDSTIYNCHYNMPAWMLSTGKVYYWRVAAMVDGVLGYWSTVCPFSTTTSIDGNRVFIAQFAPSLYQVVYLEEWDKYYTDRTYQVRIIPPELKSLLWIRTQNGGDKSSTLADMISFQLLKASTIFVAYDNRCLKPPAWLSAKFSKTNLQLGVTDKIQYFDVWQAHFEKGKVILGGNMEGGAIGAKTNYIVLLKPDVLVEPKITVLSPLGGEIWLKGSNYNISWNSNGAIGANVKIDLYKAGSSYRTITTAATNTGSFSWVIPMDLSCGFDYRIRISSINDESINDDNDRNFTIEEPPLFTVLSPANGSSWLRGVLQYITWSSLGNVGTTIKLDLYKAGRMCQPISAAATNSGAFAWSVSAEIESGNEYMIKISAIIDTSIYSYSKPFAILSPAPAPVTLIAPSQQSRISDNKPTFSWSASSYANEYRIQIDDDILFTLPLIDQKTSSTNFTPILPLNAGKYYWRVMAKNESGESNWSSEFTILILATGVLHQVDEGVVDHYFMEQNYPNPFNAVTTIRFGMPQADHVELTITNINGQLVELLFSGFVPAGAAAVSWNASSIRSGIYYIVMSTPGFQNCRKMLLIK